MSAIIVHGGAWCIPDSLVQSVVKGCEKSALEGHKKLLNGGSALDAVETAVRALEDDPVFNAGHGSALNVSGEIEMDAIVMDGRILNFGAVACLKRAANPVSVARLVMEKTDHVMLAGDGANQFAKEMNVPEASLEELTSPVSKAKWEQFREYRLSVEKQFNRPTDPPPNIPDGGQRDTVGAVALDQQGNIACATSTGGITFKRVGRVGDVPLVGCGAYSDNNLGGVSCTGHGESIARAMLARRVLCLLEDLPPQKAVEQALGYMFDKTDGGRGGLIMITKDGTVAKGFTTSRMAWASIDTTGQLLSGTDNPRFGLTQEGM